MTPCEQSNKHISAIPAVPYDQNPRSQGNALVMQLRYPDFLFLQKRKEITFLIVAGYVVNEINVLMCLCEG
jgi:hypothetical protein